MAQLSIFDPTTLPEAHAHQIRSFIRMHWHDEYLYDLDAPLFPPERHPRHVVVHERHALLSHARVIWVDFAHAGENWRLYCLGDVLTYPAFRRRGHGGEVVGAATRLIRSDEAADAAILSQQRGSAVVTPGDRRDINRDGVIDIRDVRALQQLR